MRIKETLAPLSAAVLLTGCAAGSHETATKAQKTVTETSTSTIPKLSKAQKWTFDMEQTLNRFRNDVLFKHEARIALGACVAWPSYLSDGSPATNVTLNPGLAETEGDEYYIFSTHDPRFKPSWGPLNGPKLLSPKADLLILTKGHYIDAKTPRKLLPREQKDKSGQRFFEDAKTKEPVMDTAIIPGILALHSIENACVALKQHRFSSLAKTA